MLADARLVTAEPIPGGLGRSWLTAAAGADGYVVALWLSGGEYGIGTNTYR